MTGSLPNVAFLATDPEEVGGFLRAVLPTGWSLSVASDAGDACVAACDYLVVAAHSVRRQDMEPASNLRLLHKVGVGYDDIDTPGARDLGIGLAVCTLGSTEAVAEHALSLALAAVKSIPDLNSAVRDEGRWPKWEMRGRLRHLGWMTVGIVGLGRIGGRAAQLFGALGCQVVALSRAKQRPDLPGIRFVDTLDELFEAASVVSLHTPLTAETRGMVTERHLRMLGPEGLLVNTARGEVVDEVGLVRALTDGGLGAAALDVLAHEPVTEENPLRRLPNVILTPHVGGGGSDVLREKCRFIARNLENFHFGRAVENLVIPSARPARGSIND